MINFLIVIGVSIIAFILLALYSCLVVAGRADRQMENWLEQVEAAECLQQEMKTE